MLLQGHYQQIHFRDGRPVNGQVDVTAMGQVLERVDLWRRVLDRQVREERAFVRVDEHEARHAPSTDGDAHRLTF